MKIHKIERIEIKIHKLQLLKHFCDCFETNTREIAELQMLIPQLTVMLF
jgi:hypothetical protein